MPKWLEKGLFEGPEGLIGYLIPVLIPGIFGLIMAGVIALGTSLAGWAVTIRRGVLIVKRVAPVTKSIVGTPAAKVFRTFAATALILLGQIGTLMMCYIGGNFVASIFYASRVSSFLADLTTDPTISTVFHDASVILSIEWAARLVEIVRSHLVMDTISASYLVFAALMLLLSYRGSPGVKGDSGNTLGWLMALPGAILLLACIAVSALYIIVLMFAAVVGVLQLLLDPAGLGEYVKDIVIPILPFLTGFATCWGYCMACLGAVRSSVTLKSAWADLANARTVK